MPADAQPCTPDRFRRYSIHPVTLLATMPATHDGGRFYPFDPIKASEDCGTTPTQGFRPASNNTKRPVTHTKGIMGVSGGFTIESSPVTYKPGKVNTKHAQRRMAKGTQRHKS